MKEKTTVAELLRKEGLPVPVRDWLERFITGRTLPYTEPVDIGFYNDVELFVAIVADHIVTNDSLPQSVIDYVEEFLYQLEWSTDVHIWNTPDLLRVALSHMMEVDHAGATYEGNIPVIALKTVVKSLCTGQEYAEFLARHGLSDPDGDQTTGKVQERQIRDRAAVMKCARILANPDTPRETRRQVKDAINELMIATQVTPYHPALIERALTIMFEVIDKPKQGMSRREMKRGYKNLHELLERLPDFAEAETP